jgi:hypothetical protein
MADDQATARDARSARPVTIYVLIDPRDGRVFYVGKTESPMKVRLSGHICDALAGRSSAASVIREIVAADLKPVIQSIEIVVDGEWAATERKWIAHYRLLGPLCNRAKGGEGVSGVLRTNEWISRVIASRRRSGRAADGAKRAAEKIRGRKHSDETKAKMSTAKKGRRPSDATIAATGARYRGKKFTPEQAAKCGLARRGKPNSNEHRAKQRAGMLPHRDQISREQSARWRDPEYRARMLASRAGRKLTDAHKKLLGEASKLAWRDPQSRKNRIESLLIASKDPEVRAKNSAAVKAKWADPAWRAAMMLARRRRHPA